MAVAGQSQLDVEDKFQLLPNSMETRFLCKMARDFKSKD